MKRGSDLLWLAAKNSILENVLRNRYIRIVIVIVPGQT